MKFLTVVALAVVMLWVPVDGVAQDRDPLKGLTGVNVQGVVEWDDLITNINRGNYTQRFQNAFELGIRGVGLRVGDSDGYPILRCSNRVLLVDGGRVVVYGLILELQEIVVPWQGTGIAEWDKTQYARTWLMKNLLSGGLGELGSTATDLGADCAEIFELGWRRANN